MTTPDPVAPNPIETEILRLTQARGPEKSICPSEVAHALADTAGSDQWRPLLTPVRQAAIRLAQAGRIEILRKGRPINPAQTHGVIRLRIHIAMPDHET
jgi:hypothetical protein